MTKGKIESRYTIEYINPDQSNSSSSNVIGKIAMFSVLVLLITLGVIFSSLFPTEVKDKATISINTREENTLEQPQKTTEINKEKTPKDAINNTTSKSINPNQTTSRSQFKLLEDTINEKNSILSTVDKLKLESKKQEAQSKKQLEENQILTRKLDALNKQLTSEKSTNERLSNQINLSNNKNSELSSLLEQALQDASLADSHYIASIEKNDIPSSNGRIVESHDAVVLNESSVKSQTAKSRNSSAQSTSVHKNTVNLSSTASQVDKILSALKETTSRPDSTTTNTNRTTVAPSSPRKDLVDEKSITSSNNSLALKLQDQINELIESGSIQTTSYNDSLTTESQTRSNSVRSIIVKKGETLWSISERAYGNGSFFKKIINANPHIENNGKILLRVGQVINVPR